MFTKETVEEIIEECFGMVESFDEEHNGRAKGKCVRICTAGVDGGGLSTYGKSAVINWDDEYECRDGYLYIHGSGSDYDIQTRKRYRFVKSAFIAYESIVSIECAPKAWK